MDFFKIHKIITKIFQEFKNYHIYIEPLDNESLRFNICEQKLMESLSFEDKRINGFSFSITPKDENYTIDIEDIVVMKKYRRKGKASLMVHLLLNAIGKRNIFSISLIDCSKGFWESMREKYKAIKWDF